MSDRIKALNLKLFLHVAFWYNCRANYCNTALICIIVLKWKVLFVHQKKQVLATFSYTVQISQLQFQCFAVERYQFLLSTTQSWMFHDKYYPLIFIGCNLIYFTVLSLTKQLIQSCYMLTVLQNSYWTVVAFIFCSSLPAPRGMFDQLLKLLWFLSSPPIFWCILFSKCLSTLECLLNRIL